MSSNRRARQRAEVRPDRRLCVLALAVGITVPACNGTRGTLLFLERPDGAAHAANTDAETDRTPYDAQTDVHEAAASEAGANPGDAAASEAAYMGDAASSEAGPGWAPALTTSWQIQLSGPIDTSVDVTMYDVDLFTAADTIANLKNQGRVVVCFLSAGSFEPGRDDASSFPPEAVGNALRDYPSERWLDVRNGEVRSLMVQRLDVGRQRGCDGVEITNLTGHLEDTGFNLTQADVLDYLRWISAQSRQRGFSVGIATSPDLLVAAEPSMDWGFAEECATYNECEAWRSIVDAGKAVFMLEYGTESTATTLCPEAERLGFNLLIKRRSLDAYRVTCPQ